MPENDFELVSRVHVFGNNHRVLANCGAWLLEMGILKKEVELLNE